MAEKLGMRAESQWSLHDLKAATVPPLPRARDSKPRECRLQVTNDRQTQFATVVEEPDRIGIVVAHADLKFANDTNMILFHRGLKSLMSVRLTWVERCPRNETIGIALDDVDDVVERHADAC